VKDGRAGIVEMSAKNICLIGGTGLSILVAPWRTRVRHAADRRGPAGEKLFYEGGVPKKVV
jgi:hypothetical protein